MTPRPFRDLTRRERLFRYRDLAKIALHAYGMEDAQVTFLQYLANVIYTALTCRAGQPRVLRKDLMCPTGTCCGCTPGITCPISMAR